MVYMKKQTKTRVLSSVSKMVVMDQERCFRITQDILKLQVLSSYAHSVYNTKLRSNARLSKFWHIHHWWNTIQPPQEIHTLVGF